MFHAFENSIKFNSCFQIFHSSQKSFVYMSLWEPSKFQSFTPSNTRAGFPTQALMVVIHIYRTPRKETKSNFLFISQSRNVSLKIFDKKFHFVVLKFYHDGFWPILLTTAEKPKSRSNALWYKFHANFRSKFSSLWKRCLICRKSGIMWPKFVLSREEALLFTPARQTRFNTPEPSSISNFFVGFDT